MRRSLIPQNTGDCLRRGINLLCQDLLFLAETINCLGCHLHLVAKLLLSTTQICHPREDEVEALHDLLPVFIITMRNLLHCVQHELGLRGRFRGRRGDRTASQSERERNYGQRLRCISQAESHAPHRIDCPDQDRRVAAAART